jgi:hypothetical protein
MAKWMEWLEQLMGRRAAAPVARTVTATRMRPPAYRVPTVSPVAGKYALLYEYLERRYADVVVLTFGQIEDLLGSALPDVARTTQPWWGAVVATAGVPAHSDAWTMAGRTASPNLLARNVVFERTASAKR